MLNRHGVAVALALLIAPCGSASACVGMTVESVPGSGPAAAVCASSQIAVPDGKGKTFHVGPGQALAEIGDVPWFDLQAGDTVYIHHRPTPYHAKILVSGRGRADQWIRILGVPDAAGTLPVISGSEAKTPKTMRYRWDKPELVEWLGVVQIAVGPDSDDGTIALPPAYIEIANLQVQDGFETYRFQASDGRWINYDGFAACIYARSVAHLVVRNNILTNCGQGFYNWTGDGSSPSWWSALQTNTVLSGNYIYNNGNPTSFLEHQIYTESDGVTIEYNRLGPQRAGAQGSQIKDRSIGTVIRYNRIEQSPRGWTLDLVQPEESVATLGGKPQFKQTFVYGNAIISNDVDYPNVVHWNEDHQTGKGRAAFPDGRLFFYQNTIAISIDRADNEPVNIFNGTWGGFDCPPSASPGIIDARNNIIALFPAPGTRRTPPLRLGYCKQERVQLGRNWLSPSILKDTQVTGWPNLVPSSNNDPGFTARPDLRLKENAPAAGAGGDLAPETKSNSLGADHSPTLRFIDATKLGARPVVGAGSDLGAF